MRIAVVGGGPGGLYFARLLRKRRPDISVDVFERGPEGATWGFGVGLGSRALSEIGALDSEVHDALLASMRFERNHIIRLNNETLELTYDEATGAISRLELLNILTRACVDVGVRIHFRSEVPGAKVLEEFDMIVAADGAGSGLRSEREDEFGTVHRTLTNHFAWYGVRRTMPMGLIFRSFGGGTFVGHHYAYATNMSTFVAECDDATWRLFGLEVVDDDVRKALLERVFEDELGGAPLVSNRSIWRQFPAVANDRFYAGTTALIGDSLRVAHFSIGSGTRLAMEDAAALCSALVESDYKPALALERYEHMRRPVRDKFGEAARRSFEWYERIAEHMHQPIVPFVHDFLTRTGRVSDDRLRTYVPEFHRVYERYRAGTVH